MMFNADDAYRRQNEIIDQLIRTVSSDNATLNQKLKQLCRVDCYFINCKNIKLDRYIDQICNVFFPALLSLLSVPMAKQLHSKYMDTFASIIRNLCIKTTHDWGLFENRILKGGLSFPNRVVSNMLLSTLIEILDKHAETNHKISMSKNNAVLACITIGKLINTDTERIIKIYNIIILFAEFDSSPIAYQFVNLMEMSIKLYQMPISGISSFNDLKILIRKFVWKMVPYFSNFGDFIQCSVIQLYNESLNNFQLHHNGDLFGLLSMFIDAINANGSVIYSDTIYQCLITVTNFIYSRINCPGEWDTKNSLLYYHLKLLSHVLGNSSIGAICHTSYFKDFVAIDNSFKYDSNLDPDILFAYMHVCHKICVVFPHLYHSLEILDMNAYNYCFNLVSSINSVKDEMFQLTAVVFIDNGNSTIKFLKKLMSIICCDNFYLGNQNDLFNNVVPKLDVYFQVFSKFYTVGDTFSNLIYSQFVSHILTYFQLKQVNLWMEINSGLYEEIISYLVRSSNFFDKDTQCRLNRFFCDMISDEHLTLEIAIQLLRWHSGHLQLHSIMNVENQQSERFSVWVGGILKWLNRTDFDCENQEFMLSLLLKILKLMPTLDEDLYAKLFSEMIASFIFDTAVINALAVEIISFIPISTIWKLVHNHHQYSNEHTMNVRNNILKKNNFVLQTKYLKNLLYRGTGLSDFNFTPELFSDDTITKTVYPSKFEAFIFYLWRNIAPLFTYHSICDFIPRLLNNLENLLLRWIKKSKIKSEIYFHLCVILQTIDFMERIAYNIKFESFILDYMSNLLEKASREPLYQIVDNWLLKNRKYLFVLCVRYKLLKNAFYQFSCMVDAEHHNQSNILPNNDNESISSMGLKSYTTVSSSSVSIIKEKSLCEFAVMLLNEIIKASDGDALEDLLVFFEARLDQQECRPMAHILRLINEDKFSHFLHELLLFKSSNTINTIADEASSIISSITIDSEPSMSTTTAKKITLAKNTEHPQKHLQTKMNPPKKLLYPLLERMLDVNAADIFLKYIDHEENELFHDYYQELDNKFNLEKLSYNLSSTRTELSEWHTRATMYSIEPLQSDNIMYDVINESSKKGGIHRVMLGSAINDLGNPNNFVVSDILKLKNLDFMRAPSQARNGSLPHTKFYTNTMPHNKFYLDKMNYLVQKHYPDSANLTKLNHWMFEFCVQKEIYCLDKIQQNINGNGDKQMHMFDAILYPCQKEALSKLFHLKSTNEAFAIAMELESSTFFNKLMCTVCGNRATLDNDKLEPLLDSMLLSRSQSQQHKCVLINSTELSTFTNQHILELKQTVNMYVLGFDHIINDHSTLWFNMGQFISAQNPLNIYSSNELEDNFEKCHPESTQSLRASLGETNFSKIFVELKRNLMYHISVYDYIPSSSKFNERINSLLPIYDVASNDDVLSFVSSLLYDTIYVQRIALYAYCQFALSKSVSNKQVPLLVISTIINLLASQCNCANIVGDTLAIALEEHMSILKKLPKHIWKHNLNEIINILVHFKNNSFNNEILMTTFEDIIQDFVIKSPHDIVLSLFSKILSNDYFNQQNGINSPGYNYVKSALETLSQEHSALFDEYSLFYNSVIELAPSIAEQSFEYFKCIETELEKIDTFYNDGLEQLPTTNTTPFNYDIKNLWEKWRLSLWMPMIVQLNKLTDYYLGMRNWSNLSKHRSFFLSSIHMHLMQLKNIIDTIFSESSTDEMTSTALLKYLVDQLSELIVSIGNFVNKRLSKFSLRNFCPELTQLHFNELRLSSKINADGYIQIACVREHFKVLSSKTKPKQIQLLTTSGHLVTYLIKGGENINVDKHVSSIIQGMCSLDTVFNKNIVRLNPYEIIAVGNNCGLIEYLTNISPVYALYNKCLESKRSHQILLDPTSPTDSSSTPKHERYSDSDTCGDGSEVILNSYVPKGLYGKKLIEIAKRHNENVIRPNMPIPVLKEVFEEMCDEFPDNLIQKELFMASNNASQYINSQRLFTRSCATMNILGYIVGLGDRHLGNILLNFTNGFIAHIDYNICFDRGKLLSVPENVPFRLTRNFVKAFGSFGHQGNYTTISSALLKFCCEHNFLVESYLSNCYYGDCSEWSYNHRLSTYKSMLHTIHIDDDDNNNINQSRRLPYAQIISPTLPPNHNSTFYYSTILYITYVIRALSEVFELNNFLIDNNLPYRQHCELLSMSKKKLDSCKNDVTSDIENVDILATTATTLTSTNSTQEKVFVDFNEVLWCFLDSFIKNVTSSSDIVVMNVAWVLLCVAEPKLNIILNTPNKQNIAHLLKQWKSEVDMNELFNTLVTILKESNNEHRQMTNLFNVINPESCSKQLALLQSEYTDISLKQRSLNEALPSLQNKYSVLTLKLTNVYEGMARKTSLLISCCAFLQLYNEQINYGNANSERHLFKNSGMIALTSYGKLVGYVNIILRFLMNSDTELNVDSSLSLCANVFGEITKLFSLYEGFYYALKTSILPTIQYRYISMSRDLNRFHKKFDSLIASNSIYKSILSWNSDLLKQNIFSLKINDEYYDNERSVEEFYRVVSNIYDITFCGLHQPYHALFEGILTFFNCINSTIAIIQDADKCILDGLRKVVMLFKVEQIKFFSKFAQMTHLFEFNTNRSPNCKLLDHRIWMIDSDFIGQLQQILSDTLNTVYNDILIKVVTSYLLNHVMSILLNYVSLPAASVERIIQSDVEKLKRNFKDHHTEAKTQSKGNENLLRISHLMSLWSQIDTLKIYNIQLSSIMKECDLTNYHMFRYMFLKQFLSPNIRYQQAISYLNNKCPSTAFSDGGVKLLKALFKLKYDIENTHSVNGEHDEPSSNEQKNTELIKILPTVQKHLIKIEDLLKKFQIPTSNKCNTPHETLLKVSKEMASFINDIETVGSAKDVVSTIYNKIENLTMSHFNLLDVAMDYFVENKSIATTITSEISIKVDEQKDGGDTNESLDEIATKIEKLYLQNLYKANSVNKNNLLTIIKRVHNKMAAESVRRECDVKSRPFSYERYAKILNKNALSTTNLCKMYEGWTSWI